MPAVLPFFNIFLHHQLFQTSCVRSPLQLLIRKVKEMVPSHEEMVSLTYFSEEGMKEEEGGKREGEMGGRS